MVRTRLTSHYKAVRLSRPGGPLSVETLTRQRPGPGEVAVQLRYAGVNPLDGYIRAGAVGSPDTLPRTLGVEGVGELDGQWYVVHGGGLGVLRDGTWAEHAVVPRQALVPVPAGLDLRLAATAGVVGSTAVRVTCDLGEVGPADRALVLGAGGGTGVAISSLARSRGALVWGQVGDPAKVEAVRQSGAEPILAGSAAQLHEQIAELGITVAFDPLGGAYTAALVAALVPRGRLISYGVSAGEQVTLSMRTVYRNNLTVRGFGGVAEPAERLSASIRLALQHLAAGSMRIPVDRVLPLAAADRALAALANREVAGKALLDTRA